LCTSILVSSTLLLAASGGGSDSNQGMAEFSLNVNDAAIDGAEAVIVEFSGVTLKPAGW
jgi:hypothetical protein